ncbi:hypothetical protein ACVWWN_003682 [Mycobacterium sp. URHB0021]|jgi:hypothetical protein
MATHHRRCLAAGDVERYGRSHPGGGDHRFLWIGFHSFRSHVFALHRRAHAGHTGELTDTNLVVRVLSGGVSGGTVGSNDPYTLTPDRAAEPELGPQADIRWRQGREIAPELDGYWLGAFVMAAVNSRIVRRSIALLDYAYGRRPAYAEQMSLGRSVVAPVAAALATGGNAATMALGSRFFHRLPGWLIERIAPRPGTARASGPGRTATAPSRRTPPRPAHVTRHACRSEATTATRRRRCCWGRAGWRWRGPRSTLGSARCADSGRGDGRSADGPIPRCGCVIGDLAAGLNSVSPGPSRTPVHQDRVD